MASIRRRGKGWQAQVFKLGVRKSASFRTKAEASAWSAKTELEIQTLQAGQVPDYPFSKALERYRDEVSVSKRGSRRESIRIDFLLKDPLAAVPLPLLGAGHFATWRDRRLREVSAASVLRDWGLLNHVVTVAINEWGWLKESPLKGVRKPKAPLPRDRRISQLEIDKLLLAFGYIQGQSPRATTARVGAAFLFAIETAMRAGEICSLQWANIEGPVAHLPITKNGFPRSVPLSPGAIKILESLPRDTAMVFNLQPSQLDALFRKARARALIDDLHFHDTRHEAITRLARKLDVLDLARMVGIRDLRILMVYYNAQPDEIARRLG